MSTVKIGTNVQEISLNLKNVQYATKPIFDDNITLKLEKLQGIGYSPVNAQHYRANYIAFLGTDPQTKKVGLSETEVRKLIEKVQKSSIDSDEALNKLTVSYEGLVKSIANKYTGFGVDFEDLAQEGQIGLIKAIFKADVSSEDAFSTYAHSFIKGHVVDYIQNNSTSLSYSKNLTRAYSKFINVRHKLEKMLGRVATNEEICKEMEISEEKLEALKLCSQKVSSIQEQIFENKTLEDTLPSCSLAVDNKVIKKESDNQLKSIFKENLSPKEAKIMEMLYMESLSPNQIANKLKMNNSTVIEHILLSIKKLIKEPEFVTSRGVTDIENLTNLIKVQDFEKYIHKIKKLFPEFVPLVDKLIEDQNNACSVVKIKDSLAEVIDKAGLTDVQRKLVESICDLRSEDITKNQNQLESELNLSEKAISKLKSDASMKLDKTVKLSLGYKPEIVPTFYEIVLFTRDLDKLVEEAKLTEKEKEILNLLFDGNGILRDQRQLVKKLGYRDDSRIAAFKKNIYSKFLKAISENEDLKPVFPLFNEIKRPEILNKILKTLSLEQRKIISLNIKSKTYQEISDTLNLNNVSIVNNQKNNAVSKLKKYFPNCFDNLDILLNRTSGGKATREYLEHLILRIPEFSYIKKQLDQEKGGSLTIEDIKAIIQNIIEKANLSPRQRQAIDLILDLNTDKEIAEKLGIDINTADNHISLATKKISKVLIDNYNVKPIVKPSIYEIVLLSDDINSLMEAAKNDKKTALTDLELKILKSIINEDGRVRELKELSEVVGASLPYAKKVKYILTAKLQEVINTNPEFKPKSPTIEEFSTQKYFNIIKNILTPLQQEIFQQIYSGKPQREIAREMGVTGQAIDGQKKNILVTLEHRFPNNIDNIIKLIRK